MKMGSGSRTFLLWSFLFSVYKYHFPETVNSVTDKYTENYWQYLLYKIEKEMLPFVCRISGIKL